VYSNVGSGGLIYTATCLVKLVAKGNISRTKESWENVGRFIGKDGNDGLPGEAGVGIKETKVEYAISTDQSIPESGWSETTPPLINGSYL
jgi:hypothetical protein